MIAAGDAVQDHNIAGAFLRDIQREIEVRITNTT
jgi:hypothetical protein